jgi:serine/threonine-protein kinase
MARLWLATGPDGKVVVIRQLLPRMRWSPAKRRTFARGMQIQARMQHPNIIQVYELQRWCWAPYAVLEYTEGVNLRQALGRGNEFLSEDFAYQTLYFFEKMVEALYHVHQQGYMHMDFKPENVLISHAGEIKLFDFDLAHPIPKKPRVFTVIHGTPSYLAPEQILRRPVDERVDIFALGITAYEMFTGRKPFESETQSEVFANYANLNLKFPSAKKLNASLPPILGQIIERCAEKPVERRYPSLFMLLKDLQKLQKARETGAI